MPAVVFSDFNCPFCYATEERLHALGLTEQVQWRGVQHAPELPAPMALAGPALAATLATEVATVRRISPGVPIELPPGKPNTQAAIARAAAALSADPATGRAFVRALYRALWIDGADLSDSAVLGALARQSGVTTAGADGDTAAQWSADWSATGVGGVPLILRPDGRALYGLHADDELQAFLTRA